MLPTKVKFGSPQNKCLGHGICEIIPWKEIPNQPSLQCKPIKSFWLRSPEGFLGLMVPTGLAPSLVNQHFSGTNFKIEEPILLPKFLQKHFNLPESYLIPAGHFQLFRSPYFFFIYFKEPDSF